MLVAEIGYPGNEDHFDRSEIDGSVENIFVLHQLLQYSTPLGLVGVRTMDDEYSYAEKINVHCLKCLSPGLDIPVMKTTLIATKLMGQLKIYLFSTNYFNIQPRWGWWVSGAFNSGFHPELTMLNSFGVPVQKTWPRRGDRIIAS